MTDLNIDAIIKQLNEVRTTGKQAQLSESKIRQLCNISREIFLEDSNLLEINAPVHIFGDIHGQFEDLLRHFDLVGTPDTERCLFLGDYVDRCRKKCFEVIGEDEQLRVFNKFIGLKTKNEQDCYLQLLMCTAKVKQRTGIYGFYDECKRRYNIKLWKTFTDCFNCLPLAAIVENTIFCVHGGLSPDLNDLDQIRQMVRPMDIPDHGIAADLLWSDPDEDITGWGDNDRGVSWTFGGDIVQTFLKKNNFSLVARAHQVVEDGYQFFQKRKLVTLFSAPNYCGEFDNAAAVMSVSAELLCSFCITKPKSVLEFEEEMKKIKK